MNNIQEKIILNNHIDNLCDLYAKGRFYTVIQTAKKLLLRYKDSVALLNILGMSNAKINKYEDAIVNYKKAISGKLTFLLLITVILDKIIPSFSIFLILFQHGVIETPTFLDNSVRGIFASFCKIDKICLSILSVI